MILCEGAARRGFELLRDGRSARAVLPEITAMEGVEQSPEHHPEGDVWQHTLRLLEQLRAPTETLALRRAAARRRQAGVRGPTRYAHGRAHHVLWTSRARRRDGGRDLPALEAEPRGVGARRLPGAASPASGQRAADAAPPRLNRFLREDGIEELLELARIDALASSGDLQDYEFCRARRAELCARADASAALRERPRSASRSAIARGALCAEILHAVEEAQLEGTLTNREAALAWVREHYPKV